MLIRKMFKLRCYFLSAVVFFISVFLYSPSALASSYTVNPNCSRIPSIPGYECSDSVTVTLTAADKGAILGANSFDDYGTLTVTLPSGASSSLTIGSSSSFGPASLGVGTNIFSMFSEGPGIYTITVWARDTGGVGMGANAIIKISTGPTCALSASPDGLLAGYPEDVTVSWTTGGAVSTTLDGASVTPVVSGSKTFTGVSSAIIYVLAATDSDGVTATCSAAVSIAAPPVGGIVPCGRLADNPVTPYNEKEPCTLCHIFIMLQIISTFVIEIGGIVAVLFLVVGGLIYATSAGSQNRMELGKKTIMWAIFGLAIIFLSWLIVTIVLTSLGYINPLGGQWNIVGCTVV